MENITVKELLQKIESKLDSGDVRDSVHQIKLITTKEMIEKVLKDDFQILEL